MIKYRTGKTGEVEHETNAGNPQKPRERERERERERNKPCGLISRICVSAIMLFIGTIVPFEVFSADLNNPEIQRLIAEKQQKIAALEKCSKKVKGFKIAGISTIGLTAIGVGGNIALASKREQVSGELATANQTLSAQQAAERAAAEEARKKAECDQDTTKEWKDGECKDKVTTPPTTNGNNNPETPETTITNNNENVEAEVDIDENQQGEEIVQEVVTTTNTDEDAKKRLAEQKRLEEVDSLYAKLKTVDNTAREYGAEQDRLKDKILNPCYKEIKEIIEKLKEKGLISAEARDTYSDGVGDYWWEAMSQYGHEARLLRFLHENLSNGYKAYKAEIKAHNESNITTMREVLAVVESYLKDIKLNHDALQIIASKMCAERDKIKKDLHL